MEVDFEVQPANNAADTTKNECVLAQNKTVDE